MEANGEWHTSDNKYGSSTWKAIHPVASASAQATSRSSSSAVHNSPPKPVNGHTNGKAKAKASEILVLDSDDEDEGQVKRELSPSFGSGSSLNQSFDTTRQTQSQASDVIDLTLDSEEEEESPPPKQIEKRKAIDANLDSTSPTEQIWKKGRLESDRSVAPGGSSSNASNVEYHALPTPSRSTPHSSPLQYSVPYQGVSPYALFGGSPTGGSPGTSLPGINTILPRRWT